MKADGDEVDGFQVAYLHSKNAKGSRVSETNVVDIQKATLDVVFVIDTTASMQPMFLGCGQMLPRICSMRQEALGPVGRHSKTERSTPDEFE